MAKKVACGLVGAVLLGLFLFGTRFFGYMGTVAESVQNAAQEQVPFSMKLNEAKKKVARTDDAITEKMKQMANLKSDIKTLNEDIAATEKTLKTREQEMAYLSDKLKAGDKEYVSVKTTKGVEDIRVSEATNKLKMIHASYKRAEKQIALDQESLDQKQARYDEYNKQLGKLVDLKETMQQRIETLESEHAALETRKVTESVEYDDSDLQEADKLLKELEKDIEVQHNMLDLKKDQSGIELDLSAEEELDILEEVGKTLEGKSVEKSDELISIER